MKAPYACLVGNKEKQVENGYGAYKIKYNMVYTIRTYTITKYTI